MQIVIKNGGLIVNNLQKQLIRINIEVLVDQIQFVLLAIIAHDILFLISIAQLHDLLPNQIVNMAFWVRIHKAVVAHPKSTCYDVGEFLSEYERIFKTFVILFPWRWLVFLINVLNSWVIIKS